MIEVENLTKHYGATKSLDGLTFSVPEGEVLGFLGPNGAGKTTTMRILTGLSRATSGSARVAGFDVQKDHLRIRSLLGYLPESAPIYDEMRVDSYLRFMAGMKLIPHRRVSAETDRVLEETDLLGWRKRLAGNLSKGTRQRLGIAQALLGDPKILIMDEPTVGLDPTQISDVRQLIAGMKGRRTVIFSTHILPNVSFACSSVVILNEGRIIAQGPIDEIGHDLDHRHLLIEVHGQEDKARKAISRALRKHHPRIRTLASGDKCRFEVRFSGKDDPRPAVARGLVENGLDLLELREHRASLEDVFLRVTSDAIPREAGK